MINKTTEFWKDKKYFKLANKDTNYYFKNFAIGTLTLYTTAVFIYLLDLTPTCSSGREKGENAIPCWHFQQHPV